MKALIDGDILLYSCGFAVQKNFYSVEYDNKSTVVDCENKREANKLAATMGGEVLTSTEVEPLSHALQNLDTAIRATLTRIGATSYIVFLSGKNNFRDKLVDNYKANRDPTHKPHWYSEMRDHLLRKWAAQVAEGQEADDAMSIYQCGAHDEVTIICTIDKDLNMVPGPRYDWNKGKLYAITPLQGIRFFYKQIITGDTTDNIFGLYKLKKQRATKKLLGPIDEMEQETDMWEYVCKVFKGVDTQTIITNARLLWMRREENEMWEPPEHCEMGCIFYEGKLHGDCRAPSSDGCRLNLDEKKRKQEKESSEEVHGQVPEISSSGEQEEVQEEG